MANNSDDHDRDHDEMLNLSLGLSSRVHQKPTPPDSQPPPLHQPSPPHHAPLPLYQSSLPFLATLEVPFQQLPIPSPNLQFFLPFPQITQNLPVLPTLPTQADHLMNERLRRSRPRQTVRQAPRRTRQRLNPQQVQDDVNNGETIPAPYPWSTNRRATVRSLSDLLESQIDKIRGQMKCKNCLEEYELELDLREKFKEVGDYLAENRDSMCDRAPEKWMNPVYPTCGSCNHENSVKPVIHDQMDSINWLFLLLNEMIGVCTLDHLKYLCKNTNNHRTGAKDRLVYIAYLTLCRQLHPDGPFRR